MQLRQAGCGEAGDGGAPLRERSLRLQDRGVAHVRVHDQLHSQAQASAREVHDEQCFGKLHYSAGQ